VNPRHNLLAILLFGSFLVVSCGQYSDDPGLSPASDYRRLQLERALEGVSVVDGLIVAEPAPVLPDDAVAALINEVDVLIEQGRRPQAIESAVAAVRGAPHATGAFTALGRALLTTSRTETTLAALATAVDRDNSNTDAWFFLGVAFDRLGRRVDAIAAWGEVVALDEGHGAAHSRLAAASWMNGDVEEARGHLVSAEALGAHVPAQLAKMIADGEPAAATVILGHRAGEAAGSGDAADVGRRPTRPRRPPVFRVRWWPAGTTTAPRARFAPGSRSASTARPGATRLCGRRLPTNRGLRATP